MLNFTALALPCGVAGSIVRLGLVADGDQGADVARDEVGVADRDHRGGAREAGGEDIRAVAADQDAVLSPQREADTRALAAVDRVAGGIRLHEVEARAALEHVAAGPATIDDVVD